MDREEVLLKVIEQQQQLISQLNEQILQMQQYIEEQSHEHEPEQETFFTSLDQR